MIKKIWCNLPKYFDGKNGVYNALVVSVAGLVLGFILAIIVVQIKTLLDGTHKPVSSEKKSINNYLKKSISLIIDLIFDIFLGVPIPAQALLIYNISRLDSIKKIHRLSYFYIGLIVITINATVHIAVMILNNIKFTDKGQVEAAYALGMNDKQAFKYVVFHQALRKSKMGILNQFIVNVQNTAFLNIIGFVDIMFIAKTNATVDLDYITPYTTVSILYLTLIFVSRWLFKCIEKRQLMRKKSKLLKK
ncbi:MAG: ABC transporter permease subunit ['Conium maculatum' witches'-broom phytoplasma]|nr:ABC transporter permease subunit ['Conium maculatum' witches'-broom phytoplasma]